MANQTQEPIFTYRFVEPGAELSPGSEIIDDDAVRQLNMDHYGAAQWAVDNPHAFFFFVAFMPSMQMPDERAQIYAHARTLLKSFADDMAAVGPSESRTQLVRWRETPLPTSFGLVQGS
ncbi:hypothetical protein LCGC14_2379230 [marine sediment metagenome]|uniref:Uncharacterized protein n=1 Tax=marine sediment metagenome TaxID=412755 RepID=A0A0F9EDU9_9ZZZZ